MLGRHGFENHRAPGGFQSELTALRIAAEHAQEIGQFGQMPQRILHSRFVLAAEKIQVKQIFPRLAMQRTRLDLGQIQVS